METPTFRSGNRGAVYPDYALDEIQLDYIRFPVDDGVRLASYPGERTDVTRAQHLHDLLARIDDTIAVPLGAEFAAGRAERSPRARRGSSMQGGEARRAGRQAPIRSSRRRTSKNSRVSWRAGGGLAADDARHSITSPEPEWRPHSDRGTRLGLSSRPEPLSGQAQHQPRLGRYT
jgi:hypothetical protein